MELAEKIADYALSLSYSDLTKEAVQKADALLVDTFGCAIGASKEKPIEIAMRSIDYRYREPTRASSIIGTERSTSMPLAAFINGGMARYFDYNDDYDAKDFSHPSDNIMPLLAVAEAEGKSGRDALLAIIAAYQIQCRLVDAVALWRRGWDHVNNGLVSVAAAASKLMGSNRKQTTEAINMALSSGLSLRQVREGRISMWKAFAFSNAARNAVFAAQLASNGMEGPSPVFEGKMGFFKEVSGPFKLSLAGGFAVTESTIKYYPVEMRAQSAVSCALGLRKGIKAEDIESILIRTTEGGYKILGSDREKWAPKNKETADHSLPYAVAAALVDGKLDVGSYSTAKLNDRRILALMKRTKVEMAKEFVSKDVHMEANALAVRLKGGRVLRRKLWYPKGHPKNPLSDRELEGKFIALSRKHMKERKRGELLATLRSFERVKDVGSIFAMTR
jgi:2-methylcitrate dehydratase